MENTNIGGNSSRVHFDYHCISAAGNVKMTHHKHEPQ